MKLNFTILLSVLAIGLVQSQTLVYRICCKTDAVSPTVVNGVDQRPNSAIRLDWVKIGITGKSETAPFYSIGDLAFGPATFGTTTFADNCQNNTASDCTGCQTCKAVTYGNNIKVGGLSSSMRGNVRVRGANNDLWIESTSKDFVVCFESDPIDVSAQKGKKLEITYQWEGIGLNGYSPRNFSFDAKVSDDPSGWWNLLLLNNPSAILNTQKVTRSIRYAIPTREITSIKSMDIIPTPVIDYFVFSIQATESFDSKITISEMNGKEVVKKDQFIGQGETLVRFEPDAFPKGSYIITVTDNEGRLSSKKFVKH